jgi:membrane protein required for colicin V production
MSLNSFDAAIYVATAVAVVMGVNSGLLRSLATIFGYVCAMPIAIATWSQVSRILTERLHVTQVQDGVALCGVFLAAGVAISALLRATVSEMVGPDVSVVDSVAGAALGAVRIGLLAVLVVMVFDRVIPTDHEPDFLSGSRLRPLLTIVGQRTLKSLPPDVADYVDQLKRERGI